VTELLATSNHERNVIVLYSKSRVAVRQNRLGAVEVRRTLLLLGVVSCIARLELQQPRHVQHGLCRSQNTSHDILQTPVLLSNTALHAETDRQTDRRTCCNVCTAYYERAA